MPQFILSDSMNAEIKAIKLQDELSKPTRNISDNAKDNSKKSINNHKRKMGFKPVISKTTNSANHQNSQPTVVNKIPENKPLIF